jgi:heptaprenyl diphosphate synthase
MRYRAESRSAASLAPVALLLSVAVTLGYVESVALPPLPVPGLRLGLANVAVLLALGTFGVRAAVMVSLGRVFLVALALGTLGSPSFVLSLGGAIAALALMALLSKAGRTF